MNAIPAANAITVHVPDDIGGSGLGDGRGVGGRTVGRGVGGRTVARRDGREPFRGWPLHMTGMNSTLTPSRALVEVAGILPRRFHERRRTHHGDEGRGAGRMVELGASGPWMNRTP